MPKNREGRLPPVRVTKDEEKLVDDAAEAVDVRVTDYIRDAVLKRARRDVAAKRREG